LIKLQKIVSQSSEAMSGEFALELAVEIMRYEKLSDLVNMTKRHYMVPGNKEAVR